MYLQHLIDYLIGIVLFYLRPLIKYFLRKTTGLCELQRICYATSPGAERTIQIEMAFNSSRSHVLKKIRDKLGGLAKEGRFTASNGREVTSLVEFACEAVCIEKTIKAQLHTDFLCGLRVSLLQMYGYMQLMTEVELMRREQFDSSNAEHEKVLKSLWSALKDEPLANRKSKQWTEIGFQGDDPATDFRGMGLLGLKQLVFFAERFPDSARLVLTNSLHPVHGYPFACTGINLTHLVWTLLRDGDLKTHFFNARQSTLVLEDFNLVYCYVFCSFNELWMSARPKDVMEFRFIKQKFNQELCDKLSNYSTILAFSPPLETI